MLLKKLFQELRKHKKLTKNDKGIIIKKNMEELVMVFAKVKEIIVSTLKLDPSKVTLEASLESDLGADSLDAVEVIMALEDEFGIEISDDAAQAIKTVGDIVNHIESQK